MYSCDKCRVMLRTLEALDLHNEVRHEFPRKERVTCPRCLKDYLRENLDKHIRVMHNKIDKELKKMKKQSKLKRCYIKYFGIVFQWSVVLSVAIVIALAVNMLVDVFRFTPGSGYYSLFDDTEPSLKEIARIYQDGTVKTYFGFSEKEAGRRFWKVMMEQKLKMECKKK